LENRSVRWAAPNGDGDESSMTTLSEGVLRDRTRETWYFKASLGQYAESGRRVLTKTYWETSAPKSWPPTHSYAAMKEISHRVLPGSSFRRCVLWRYVLVWTKPTS
jgi:hypothetical protein